MNLLLGTLGGALLAVACLLIPGVPLSDRLAADTVWGRVVARSLGKYSAVVLQGLGVALLFLAWTRVDAGGTRLRRQWVLLACWSAPLLLVPPVLSRDMYSYADQGWMFLHGLNGYVEGMGAGDGPFAYGAGGWRGQTVVYPALSIVLSGAVLPLAGGHWYWSIIAMRIPALVGLGLLIACLPRLSRAAGVEPRRAVWFGVLNPIVVVHGVGGGHNDLTMIGLASLALWIVARRGGRRVWLLLAAGGAVAGLATAVKQPGALAVLAVAGVGALGWFAGRPIVNYVLRVAISGLAGLAAFLAVSYASGLGLGWLSGTARPTNSTTASPSDLIFLLVARGYTGARATLDPELRHTFALVATGLAIAGVLAAWLRWGRRRPLRSYVAGTALWAFGFGAFRLWYLLWSLPWLLLARPGRRTLRVALAVLVGYSVQSVAREGLRIPTLDTALIGVLAALFSLIGGDRLVDSALGPPRDESAADAPGPMSGRQGQPIGDDG